MEGNPNQTTFSISLFSFSLFFSLLNSAETQLFFSGNSCGVVAIRYGDNFISSSFLLSFAFFVCFFSFSGEGD